MNDWSNLITINFVGGFCGDFICSLIYNSHYGQDIKIDPKVTKVLFNPNLNNKNNVLFDTTCFRLHTLLTDLFLIEDLDKHLDQTIINFKNIGIQERHCMMIKTLYNMAKDKDQKTYVDNVKLLYRDIVQSNLKQLTVIPFQSYGTLLDGLEIQDIFPNSKNIVVTTSHQKYFNYFRILAFHKYYNRNWPHLTIKQAFDFVYLQEGCLTSRIQSPCYMQPKDNNLTIFIDKFLFENDIEHAENIFNLKFDRQHINDYIIANKIIISKYLDIPSDFDYTDQSIIDKCDQYVNSIEGVL